MAKLKSKDDRRVAQAYLSEVRSFEPLDAKRAAARAIREIFKEMEIERKLELKKKA